jgi:hypothetical protein
MVIARQNRGGRRFGLSGVMAQTIRREGTRFKSRASFLLGALNTGILVLPAKTGFRRKRLAFQVWLEKRTPTTDARWNSSLRRDSRPQ